MKAFRRNLFSPSSGLTSALEVDIVFFFGSVVVDPQVHRALQSKTNIDILTPVRTSDFTQACVCVCVCVSLFRRYVRFIIIIVITVIRITVFT